VSDRTQLRATESGIQFVGVEGGSGEAEFKLSLADDEREMTGSHFLSDEMWRTFNEQINKAGRSHAATDMDGVVVSSCKRVLVHGCADVVVQASYDVDVCGRTNRFVKSTEDLKAERDDLKRELGYAQTELSDTKQELEAIKEGVMQEISDLSRVDADTDPCQLALVTIVYLQKVLGISTGG